jgi:hypothetical protein
MFVIYLRTRCNMPIPNSSLNIAIKPKSKEILAQSISCYVCSDEIF